MNVRQSLCMYSKIMHRQATLYILLKCLGQRLNFTLTSQGISFSDSLHADIHTQLFVFL